MAKQITYNQEARNKLLKGAQKLAQAVGSTLGPRGQNVAIDRGFDMHVVHDGVTVAKAVELKDLEENAGVRILRQAANRQVDQVGDGTTVVTILAESILSQCMQVISTGVNPMSLRVGLEAGIKALDTEIDKLIKEVTDKATLIKIATISAEDPELGDMVGELIHKVGAEGIVTVEESKTDQTYVEHQEGMQLDKGWISPFFITDPMRNEATVEKPYILISDSPLANIQEMIPFLKTQFEDKNIRDLVIIAPDISHTALGSFIATKINGGMNLLGIQAPLFGDKQKAILQDIATLTGGTVFSRELGMKFAELQLGQLGKAHRVTSTKDATLIVGGLGEKETIEDRVRSIEAEIERAEGSEWETEKLKERIGKLKGGIAIVFTGGHTEIEMRERKERAIDAVAATKAAARSGIVAGGEVVYLAIRKALGQDTTDRILYNALEQPFRKLLSNAALDAGRFMEKLEAKKYGFGVDVTTGEVVDLMESGIIDPVEVSKAALKNAISVSVQLMTTGTLITELVEKKDEENQ